MKHESVEVEKIVVDIDQPRKDLLEIDAFTDSLNILPTIEVPLIVEDMGDGRYFLVDGERRLKAAHSVGMKEVPCNIRNKLTELTRDMLRIRIDAQHKAWNTQEQRGAIRKTFELWLKEQSHDSKIKTWQDFMTCHKNGNTKLMQRFSEEAGIGQDRVSTYLGFERMAIDEVKGLHDDDTVSMRSLQKVANESEEVQEEFVHQIEDMIDSGEVKPREEPQKYAAKPVTAKMVEEELETAKKKGLSHSELEAKAFDGIKKTIHNWHDYIDDVEQELKHITTDRKLRIVHERVADIQEALNKIMDTLRRKDPTIKLEVKI